MVIDKEALTVATLSAAAGFLIGAPIIPAITIGVIAGGAYAFISWLFSGNQQPPARRPAAAAHVHYADEVDAPQHTHHHHFVHNNIPTTPDAFIIEEPPASPAPTIVVMPTPAPAIATTPYPLRSNPMYRNNRGDEHVHREVRLNSPAGTSTHRGDQHVGTTFHPTASAPFHQPRPAPVIFQAPVVQPAQNRTAFLTSVAAPSIARRDTPVSTQVTLGHARQAGDELTNSTVRLSETSTPAPTRSDGGVRQSSSFRPNTAHQAGDALVSSKFRPK